MLKKIRLLFLFSISSLVSQSSYADSPFQWQLRESVGIYQVTSQSWWAKHYFPRAYGFIQELPQRQWNQNTYDVFVIGTSGGSLDDMNQLMKTGENIETYTDMLVLKKINSQEIYACIGPATYSMVWEQISLHPEEFSLYCKSVTQKANRFKTPEEGWKFKLNSETQSFQLWLWDLALVGYVIPFPAKISYHLTRITQP